MNADGKAETYFTGLLRLGTFRGPRNYERPGIIGDIDGNGVVDGIDLGLMLEAWGPVSQGHVADLDGNHRVDASELGTLFSRWTG